MKDKELKSTLTDRKKKIQSSFAKVVARNGKALEKLSKN